jgi:ThiF family/Prokaryotic homologs of the JAB domain
MRIKLRMAQCQHETLRQHLFPGDNLEAVAVAVCGRRKGDADHVLTIINIVPVPYDECKIRTADRVTWSTARLIPLLEEAATKDWAVLKIHSHPSGFDRFSTTDDDSDSDVFASVFGWTDSAHPHCSAVMLPDGRVFGRAILPDGRFQSLQSIMVAGDDIKFWTPDAERGTLPGFVQRHAQLFGAGTTQRLRQLSVAVIGCSGTGSPLIEQLARLGVGRLVLVDSDVVEIKNLNRIVNSTLEDAYLKRSKVCVLAKAIARMGFGTEVEIYAGTLISQEAVHNVATCDVVFGCMDSIEGRHLLNRLCVYYLIPYFDVGVKLKADGHGGIDEACGAVHYLKPDGSSLMDRKAYTSEQLRAEGLKRTDPAAYANELKAGYIHGVQEDRPAVISINTQMAASAVNEFLARLHPYRLDANAESAVLRTSFMQGVSYREPEGDRSGMFLKGLGKGDVKPSLGMAELSITAETL